MPETMKVDFYLEIAGQPAISKDQLELLREKDEFRLLAISDSHRSSASVVRLLEQVPDTDMVLHLGDHAADYKTLAEIIGKPMLIVKGNCDGYDNILLPETTGLSLFGHQILMLHGHNRKINVKNGLYRLKDFSARQKPVPELVLFGHTHIYHDEIFETDGSKVRIINPGSCVRTGTSLSGGIEIIIRRSGINVRRVLC